MAALLCAKDLCKTYVIDKRQNNVCLLYTSDAADE